MYGTRDLSGQRFTWDRQPPSGTLASLNSPTVPWALFSFADGLTPPNIAPPSITAVAVTLSFPGNAVWATPLNTSIVQSVAGLGIKPTAVNGKTFTSNTTYFNSISTANSPVCFIWNMVAGSYVNNGDTVDIIWAKGSIYATVNTTNNLQINLSPTTLTGPVLVSGQSYYCVAGRDAAGNCWLWVNGKLVASGVSATASHAGTSLFICADSTSLRGYNGTITLWAVSTDSPFPFGAQLSANPWQLFAYPLDNCFYPNSSVQLPGIIEPWLDLPVPARSQHSYQGLQIPPAIASVFAPDLVAQSTQLPPAGRRGLLADYQQAPISASLLPAQAALVTSLPPAGLVRTSYQGFQFLSTLNLPVDTTHYTQVTELPPTLLSRHSYIGLQRTAIDDSPLSAASFTFHVPAGRPPVTWGLHLAPPADSFLPTSATTLTSLPPSQAARLSYAGFQYTCTLPFGELIGPLSASMYDRNPAPGIRDVFRGAPVYYGAGGSPMPADVFGAAGFSLRPLMGVGV